MSGKTRNVRLALATSLFLTSASFSLAGGIPIFGQQPLATPGTPQAVVMDNPHYAPYYPQPAYAGPHPGAMNFGQRPLNAFGQTPATSGQHLPTDPLRTARVPAHPNDPWRATAPYTVAQSPTPIPNPYSAQIPITSALPSAAIDGLLAAARNFERQGNVAAAISHYHRALEIDSTNRGGLIGFARLKHRIGDLGGAIGTYQQSLKYHPNDPVALNDMGLCQARKGNFRNALANVTAAVELRPDSKRYRNNKATLLVELNRLNEAVQTLTEVHGRPIASYNVGYMLHKRGRTDEARTFLAQAVALDPSLAPAQKLLDTIDVAVAQVAQLPKRPAVRNGTENLEPKPLGRNTSAPAAAVTATIGDLDATPAGAADREASAAVPPEIQAYPVPNVRDQPVHGFFEKTAGKKTIE